jgi:uncharacterized membrane protein YbhN (UPF0104 family)
VNHNPPCDEARVFAGLTIWGVQAAAFAVLLRAFGIDLGVGPMVVATSVANLTAVLPLSALGTFGAQEAGWTAGFVAMGVPAMAAANSGLAAHLVMVALNALMSLAFVPRLLHDVAHRAAVRALPTRKAGE